MAEKEPVLLTILIETSRLRWLAAGIGLNNQIAPLLVSHDDDLASYRNMEFDEQASFLRHRFCGVLQRASDRLWGQKKKACQFVFVIDGPFPDAPPELTVRIAEHLVQWMANPPVVFFRRGKNMSDLTNANLSTIAGEINDDWLAILTTAIPELLKTTQQTESWELVPLPKKST